MPASPPIVAADSATIRRRDGAEFLRRARRYARRNRREFRFDPAGGKGSHGKLYIGAGRTVVKHGEISKVMLRSMLKQLGIEHEDF